MSTLAIGFFGPLVLFVIFMFGYGFGVKEGVKEMLKRDAESRPYKWVCFEPGCVFEVEGDNMETVMRLASIHEATGEKHVM